mmetsp:Transcript_19027/g.44683  ORF Transcript_19027/g.44683 Transcript_19027/m.44683 type:complete len:299 (-) Transcript_19027:297-1193(-)
MQAPVSGHPVDEDLADLHANAARAQCIFHGFPGADNRDPADLPREGEAMIALTYRGGDFGLRKGQVSKCLLHNEPDQPVSIEYKLLTWGSTRSDLCVHPTGLHCGWHHVQICVDTAQVMHPQLGAYILRDEVNGHIIVFPPRDNDVSIVFARKNVPLEGRLYKASVLSNDTFDISSPLHGVALDPSRKPDVVVCVHKDFHVTELQCFLEVKDENALQNNDVTRGNCANLVGGAATRDEVVHGNVCIFPVPQVLQTLHKLTDIKGSRLVKIHIADVGAFLRRQVPVKLIKADQGNSLVA